MAAAAKAMELLNARLAGASLAGPSLAAADMFSSRTNSSEGGDFLASADLGGRVVTDADAAEDSPPHAALPRAPAALASSTTTAAATTSARPVAAAASSSSRPPLTAAAPPPPAATRIFPPPSSDSDDFDDSSSPAPVGPALLREIEALDRRLEELDRIEAEILLDRAVQRARDRARDRELAVRREQAVMMRLQSGMRAGKGAGTEETDDGLDGGTSVRGGSVATGKGGVAAPGSVARSLAKTSTAASVAAARSVAAFSAAGSRATGVGGGGGPGSVARTYARYDDVLPPDRSRPALRKDGTVQQTGRVKLRAVKASAAAPGTDFSAPAPAPAPLPVAAAPHRPAPPPLDFWSTSAPSPNNAAPSRPATAQASGAALAAAYKAHARAPILPTREEVTASRPLTASDEARVRALLEAEEERPQSAVQALVQGARMGESRP